MISRSSLKTFTTILSPLACLELLSTAQAQEGDLGGGNTNERFNALLNLSSGGFNNGLGWYSEWFLTSGFFNSAVGAGGRTPLLFALVLVRKNSRRKPQPPQAIPDSLPALSFV